LRRIKEKEVVSMNAVDLDNLKKVFELRLGSGFRRTKREVVAVQGVSLQVPQGQSLALIGPNGAGKSTMIKMLTGVLRPSSGNASVLGLCPWEQRQKLAHLVGSVFGQRSQLWYHLPPRDSFDLLAHVYDIGKSDFLNRRNELVERLGMSSFLDVPVRKLSLGQRMRAEIAASLLHKPSLLFLDEPTIGLDVVARQELRQIVREWNREHGLTVFLTSHDAGDIEAVSERVVVINHGRIVLDDTVENVRKDHLSGRMLVVVFHNDQPVIDLPGLRLLETQGKKHSYEVDNRTLSVADAVAHMLGRGEVADISVENPPLEDVIAHIYSRGADEKLSAH
jgi:ABC-2 type transport system ATP-binding protein